MREGISVRRISVNERKNRMKEESSYGNLSLMAFHGRRGHIIHFCITSETEFSAQSRLLADGSSVGATQRKLPTDRPSWCNGSCSRQVQPTALTLHAGSCPSASSRRALAAWREARRRCRGHRDHHLDQALVQDVSSPGNSCSSPPG